MANKPGEDDAIPVAKSLGKEDQALKDAQVAFFRKDVERLNAVLKNFIKISNAKAAFLITQGGVIVTKEGQVRGLDTDTVGALVSGAFAATKKLFEVFKEYDFNLTVQKGKHISLYIGFIPPKSLFTVAYDDTTNQGTIQLYAQETTKKLEAIFEGIARGGGDRSPDEQIGEDFTKGAGGALDSVFGS